MNKYLKIPYFYLFFIIIWTPISFLLGIDAMGRIKMSVWALTFLYLYHYNWATVKEIFVTSSTKILLVLVAYMLLNYLYFFIPSIPAPPAEKLVKVFSLLYPLLAFFVVATEIYEKRLDKVINVIIVAYYAWLLLLLVFFSSTLTLNTRMKVEGIDGNDFGFVAVTIVILLFVKFQFLGLSLKNFIFSSLFPLAVILLTGSRTALGCIGILVLVGMYSQLKELSPASLMRLLVIGVIAIGAYSYIMHNTAVGERLESSTDTSKLYDHQKTGTILDYMGDRGPFYYFGWMAFTKEPITGIGLANFGKKKIYTGLICHSEYMVQLSECGLIGFVLFISFLISLWVKIRSLNQLFPELRCTLYGILVTTIFIDFFFWTYDRIYIYILYATIIGIAGYVNNLNDYEYEEDLL